MLVGGLGPNFLVIDILYMFLFVLGALSPIKLLKESLNHFFFMFIGKVSRISAVAVGHY